jgi:hypothetical protein
MGEVVTFRENYGDYADQIRALLDQLGWSQRHAAERLEIHEREFRGWCAGRPCGRYVVYALEYLVSQSTSTGDQ